jgi:predicted HNH restriction endonuclease
MYDKGGHGTTSPLELDTARAADFICDVITSSSEEELLSAAEGGRRHIKVEMAIRNSGLARKRKERDGYRCQVCSFHFEDRYGTYGKQDPAWTRKLPEPPGRFLV